MNRITLFLPTLAIAAIITAASASPTPFAADAATQAEHHAEMEQFLQKFPQFTDCTIEQREQALSFYKQAEAVQSLIAEASQALTDSDQEQAQQKAAEASEILKKMAEK